MSTTSMRKKTNKFRLHTECFKRLRSRSQPGPESEQDISWNFSSCLSANGLLPTGQNLSVDKSTEAPTKWSLRLFVLANGSNGYTLNLTSTSVPGLSSLLNLDVGACGATEATTSAQTWTPQRKRIPEAPSGGSVTLAKAWILYFRSRHGMKMHLSWLLLCELAQIKPCLFLFPRQKFSLLHLASSKKILAPAANNENSPDDSFEYVPPKVSVCKYSSSSCP